MIYKFETYEQAKAMARSLGLRGRKLRTEKDGNEDVGYTYVSFETYSIFSCKFFDSQDTLLLCEGYTCNPKRGFIRDGDRKIVSKLENESEIYQLARAQTVTLGKAKLPVCYGEYRKFEDCNGNFKNGRPACIYRDYCYAAKLTYDDVQSRIERQPEGYALSRRPDTQFFSPILKTLTSKGICQGKVNNLRNINDTKIVYPPKEKRETLTRYLVNLIHCDVYIKSDCTLTGVFMFEFAKNGPGFSFWWRDTKGNEINVFSLIISDFTIKIKANKKVVTSGNGWRETKAGKEKLFRYDNYTQIFDDFLHWILERKHESIIYR